MKTEQKAQDLRRAWDGAVRELTELTHDVCRDGAAERAKELANELATIELRMMEAEGELATA